MDMDRDAELRMKVDTLAARVVDLEQQVAEAMRRCTELLAEVRRSRLPRNDRVQ